MKSSFFSLASWTMEMRLSRSPAVSSLLFLSIDLSFLYFIALALTSSVTRSGTFGQIVVELVDHDHVLVGLLEQVLQQVHLLHVDVDHFVVYAQ